VTTHRQAVFHKIHHKSKPRAIYYRRDFLDYLLMVCCTSLVITCCYGPKHVMALLGVGLCAIMMVTFTLRHGAALTVPLILRRPLEVFYALAHKVRNLTAVYLLAVAVLLLENSAIVLTPTLPHHVLLVRTIALYLFYIHFASVTVYRTAILIAHLSKQHLVREILIQTPWQRTIKEKTSMPLEMLHAYCTGVLTHITTIAPWYLIIMYCNFSLIFMPAVAMANVVIHRRWYKVLNSWFYRDHWLGHNSEFDFIYLHGPHHDAIPSGMIAVAENGFLEGFLRFTLGAPSAFYNPVIAFLVFTSEITGDIQAHQYIPGIFPEMSVQEIRYLHHSTHHYGPLEPYSIGFAVSASMGDGTEPPGNFNRLTREIKDSIKLDEELTGYRLDNPTHRRIVSLYKRYHT
jgi:hypothetical protein